VRLQGGWSDIRRTSGQIRRKIGLPLDGANVLHGLDMVQKIAVMSGKVSGHTALETSVVRSVNARKMQISYSCIDLSRAHSDEPK
jgi:hypothetical protein